MRLRTLLLLIVLGLVGYHAYTYSVTQFNQAALTYKRYVGALMEADQSRARAQALDDQALIPFQSHQLRRQYWGGEPRWTFYQFDSLRYSEDRNSVVMVVRQIVRVDPPGEDSFWGTEVRRDRHLVRLEKRGSAWKVAHFEDRATQEWQSGSTN